MVFVPASDSYLEPGGHASQTLKEHILYGLMTPINVYSTSQCYHTEDQKFNTSVFGDIQSKYTILNC